MLKDNGCLKMRGAGLRNALDSLLVIISSSHSLVPPIAVKFFLSKYNPQVCDIVLPNVLDLGCVKVRVVSSKVLGGGRFK